MHTLLVKSIVIGALASAQTAGGQVSEPVSGRPEPCYVVIAVDVSGSMDRSDAATVRSTGTRQTLRDEGQLACLQLLPFLHSDIYVGVTHFSDRPRYVLPSVRTGPLLAWGRTFLSESACRNLVRPAEFAGTFRTDIAESMAWAVGRIQAARERYGEGPAKLIILSDGDPRDSARELDRGSGPLLSMAKQFAKQQIRVYPILINEASSGSAESRSRLSERDLAAEDLMHSVASMTGGRAYRLTQKTGFVDILMDAFDLGMQVRGDVIVSQYDWAIVAVGGPMTSVAVKPVDGAGPRVLTLDGRLEGTSGILSHTISLARDQATIFRRPEAKDLVDRNWQGQWTFAPADDAGGPAIRIYRIPEFLVRLELDPELPWWRHEQIRLNVRLLDRHKRMPDLRPAALSASGEDLSVRLRFAAADEQSSFVADKGGWAVPGQLYEVEPFTIGTPGLYKLTCEVRHSIADADIPLLRFPSDAYVHSECVGVQVMNAATDEVLQEVPPIMATVPIDLEGGRDVYFRISGVGQFNVEPLSGILYLEPLPQTQWPLRKDEDGNLIAGPVPLIEREERLTGWAQVDVRTFAGTRRLWLPRFELAYVPAPLRVKSTFTDTREALWVGELHRQLLAVSAFPVFERFLERTVSLFPQTLPEMRIRTVNMRSGMTQVLEPESRQLEPPRAGGYEGRTVTATYFVESGIPIPPADRCEIDLRGTVADLEGAMKSYAVVDPMAQGLFRWTVQQGSQSDRQGAVSETLFCGEPIRLSAQWRADQNVSGVRFEIPQPDAAESLFVDLPVTAGSTSARLEQTVHGLKPGRDIPVYVHVTLQPAGVDRPLDIKLRGGQFNAEDRRVVLEELAVGEAAPSDIPGYAWEPVEIPLRAVFSGYTPTEPHHNTAIEQFKKSCVMTVTARTGDVRNITDTIEWTAVVPVEGPDKMCRLTGRAVYTPDTVGRAAVELTAATLASPSTGPSVRRAYAHVLAREPRLAVTVHRLTPGNNAEPVFDSRRWVRSDGGLSALTTRLSTRLQVDVRASGWTATGQSQPWQTSMRLVRRPTSGVAWLTEFMDTSEMVADGSLVRDIQIAGSGEYALEVVGQDVSGRRVAHFQTPVIVSIQPHEVKPAVVPPAWLSARVRQWPFEYLVTLSQDTVDLSRPQAVSFQFQLPGQREAWLDGTVRATHASPLLSVRGPRFLPALDGLQNGMVQFRLATQGLEFLRWQCPDIRVIPPVLEGLDLSGTSNGGSLAMNGEELAFDGATDLCVRPLFRTAPELEGQWAPSEMTVYLWPDRNAGPTGGPADVRILEWLQGQGSPESLNASVRAVKVDGNRMGVPAKVLPRRVRRTFLGWPKRASHERYSLVAAVVYRPKEAAGAVPGGRMIAEWSDVYAVNLDTPWVVPLLWWFLAAALVATAGAAVLRLFVPSPGRLALDMRLEENVAIVEPLRHDNPVLIDLQETSLGTELRLFAQYASSRWDLAGQATAQRIGFNAGSVLSNALGAVLRGGASVVASVQVLLRRMLYPRRWAWAAVRPRVRGDARFAGRALLCVWTGPGARRGRAWSSQSGPLELPEQGYFKSINLDLPYRVDSVDRTMRVTIRMTRMASDEAEVAVSGWREAGAGSGA